MQVHYTNEPIYKTETHRNRKQTYRYPRGKQRWEGINEEVEINVYTLQYTEQMIIEVLLYSTGNYIHYLVITCYIKEKTVKKKRRIMYN